MYFSHAQYVLEGTINQTTYIYLSGGGALCDHMHEDLKYYNIIMVGKYYYRPLNNAFELKCDHDSCVLIRFYPFYPHEKHTFSDGGPSVVFFNMTTSQL